MSPRIGPFTMDRPRWLVASVVSLATALTLAGPAHADDEEGYLDSVRSQGVPYSNLNPDGVLGSGYHYCSLMHEGMSRERIIDSDRGISRVWTPAIVDAAQHFLCPDTLPEGERPAEPEPQPAS